MTSPSETCEHWLGWVYFEGFLRAYFVPGVVGTVVVVLDFVLEVVRHTRLVDVVIVVMLKKSLFSNSGGKSVLSHGLCKWKSKAEEAVNRT